MSLLFPRRLDVCAPLSHALFQFINAHAKRIQLPLERSQQLLLRREADLGLGQFGVGLVALAAQPFHHGANLVDALAGGALFFLKRNQLGRKLIAFATTLRLLPGEAVQLERDRLDLLSQHAL